jgi:hypothetical protein
MLSLIRGTFQHSKENSFCVFHWVRSHVWSMGLP